MSDAQLSVVVPVYKCADCLTSLRDRLARVLEPIVPSFELLFVDDRSPDGSWEVLQALASRDHRVRAIRLSRNFGQHAAITAGLAASQGDWIVVMDCDLQDPPEEIPRLLAKAGEGYDIVLSKRVGRKHSLPRRVAGRAYTGSATSSCAWTWARNTALLSLLSRKVVDAFLAVRDRDRQYMLVIHWLGFARGEIEFEHADRMAGRSSYTTRQLMQVAIEGFFFETTILLRWIVDLGFALALLGTLLAVWFILAYFLFEPYAGWTSVAVLLLLIGGFIITSLGVTGLYIGKIFGQVKDRPLYVIDTVVGEDHESPVETKPALPGTEIAG